MSDKDSDGPAPKVPEAFTEAATDSTQFVSAETGEHPRNRGGVEITPEMIETGRMRPRSVIEVMTEEVTPAMKIAGASILDAWQMGDSELADHSLLDLAALVYSHMVVEKSRQTSVVAESGEAGKSKKS
jgi:hypothetical protein